MKKLMVLVLTSCLFIISQGVREVAADDAIPLDDLAGTYAETNHGSLFFCVKKTAPFPPAKCGSQGSIGFPLSILVVGSATADGKGNGCVTFTQTVSDLPVDISPPEVVVLHTAVKVKSYDSETGTGDASFTTYSGGQCHGAIFDKTGATVIATGTSHFAASEDGKRIDFVTTSLTDPVGAIGDFSFSGTDQRH